MGLVELVFIAVSLSLDAAAVAMGAGALMRLRHGEVLRIAATFGLFQGLMPLLGLALGLGFRELLLAYGNVIGSGLLLALSGKMLLEARGGTQAQPDIRRIGVLVLLAVVTSIDALVVGIMFTFIPVPLPLAIGVIGGVTFALSAAGAYLGSRAAGVLGRHATLVGALVLMAVAFKVLLW